MNKKFSPSILKNNPGSQIPKYGEDYKNNNIKISTLLRKSNEKQKSKLSQQELTGQRVKWGLNANQITDDESSRIGDANSSMLS